MSRLTRKSLGWVLYGAAAVVVGFLFSGLGQGDDIGAVLLLIGALVMLLGTLSALVGLVVRR